MQANSLDRVTIIKTSCDRRESEISVLALACGFGSSNRTYNVGAATNGHFPFVSELTTEWGLKLSWHFLDIPSSCVSLQLITAGRISSSAAAEIPVSVSYTGDFIFLPRST